MSRWIKILFFAMSSSLLGEPVSEALHALKKSPYGFELVDVGITARDLENFSLIDIQREWVFHQFGTLETIQESFEKVLGEIGLNKGAIVFQPASRLKEIVEAIVDGSGKETAWVCLRSFIPTDRYDIPRWHVDGHYYETDDLLFKFVITLVGPSTYFYPLPLNLRKKTEKLFRNRQSMKSFCKQENIISPNLGEGAIFIGGQYSSITALHSEPPIHEKRLFLSVVPCREKELNSLKARVAAMYPKDSSH